MVIPEMGFKFRIGIDVGGTFTDLVAFDEGSGQTVLIKIPSTPLDPSEGVIESFKLLKEKGQEEISMFVHASTIGTNLFLGQLGLNLPKGALVTTAGFRDVLEIGRQKRAELYNQFFERPGPLIERTMRFTLEERMSFKGQILKPVSEDEVRTLARRIKEEKAETVAIVFLHSYANHRHEKIVKEILKQELPSTVIVTSHEVDPEYREYERTSTTVINSLLIPVISKYLEKIKKEITQLEDAVPFYVMQSNGGLATIELASKIPVATLESGPATGVIASAYWSKMLEIRRMLSFDMGGTTAKAGAVINGTPQMADEYEVGGKVHSGRIIKGSGYPVRFPFIDLAEVSGGGGTIAWIDQGNALRVGPLSTGADPGPACYGKGGENPTITDANLILGRLSSKGLSGGRVKIFPELAEKALKEKIAKPLGIPLVQAANGVIEIVNTHMMRALRLVSIEKGYDPRDFAMLAFGGAGPMHAAFLAEGLGTRNIFIPPSPGVFSALGLILADFRHDFVRSIIKPASKISPQALKAIFADMESKAAAILEGEGFTPSQMAMERKLDLRYFGQSYEITVMMRKSLKATLNSFHQHHQETYGYASYHELIEVVNARLTAIGLTTKPTFKKASLTPSAPSSEALITKRKVFFEKTGWIETPIFSRDDLLPGNQIEGPAIIEQYDATTVIPPGWNALVDGFSNLCLNRRET